MFTLVFLLVVGQVQAEELRGRVVWQGPPPASERIAVKAKPGRRPDSIQGCGHEKDSPRIRVDPSGGVANVVVWVEGTAAGSPPRETVLLDQKACEFFPHVLAVRPGTDVAIRNSDPVVHSVRVFQEGKPSYLLNKWQKVKAPDLHWKTETPGRYVVRCGVHLWMYAWVVALPTELSGVSGAAGEFHLAGLSPGKHRLHFWHETAGEWELPADLSAGGLDLGTVPFPASRKE